MSVIPASRMLSAISFGVFCRWAPSTSAIMRSRKLDPGLAVMRTLIQSDRTVVPPVTADRSPPLSRITGADLPVMAASLTVATPSMTSPSPGIRSPVSTSTTCPACRSLARTFSWMRRIGLRLQQHLGDGLGPHLAQRIGLRLAAPLGHRLGEVGKQHGEPEPDGDLSGEGGPAGPGEEVAHEQDGRCGGHDLDREHHGIAGQRPRVELAERVADRRDDDRGVEQRDFLGLRWSLQCHLSEQHRRPASPSARR